MKCLLSAPPLLVAIVNAALFTGVCGMIAHAEELQMPQVAYTPISQPPVTNLNPAPPTQSNTAQAWENTLATLRNDPALANQLNNDPQLYQALLSAAAQETATEQKRLQDAQAAVQKARSQLEAAVKRLNAARALSLAERAAQQEQVNKFRQQLSENTSRLKARQTTQAALQAKLKQLESAGLSLNATLLAPKTPLLIAPQSRDLLYTPADSAALVKRNLLLTPEDRVAVKVTPLHK